MNFIYRPLYFADVEECADYLLSEAGEKVAREWYQSLKEALKQIGTHPEIGRLRRDLPTPGIRSLNLRKYPKYLLFYRVEKDSIELLRVRHGMMHLPGLFLERQT